MTDPKQIPHLIKLLDDDSSNVRTTIAKELAAFGPTLHKKIKKIRTPLNAAQKGYVGKILEGHKRVWLRQMWSAWLKLPVHKGNLELEYKRMEEALSILAEFLCGIDYDVELKKLLDDLAVAYKIKYQDSNPETLARFLFREKALRGEEDDYYNV